ncbi:MAG: B12-binding domain-containing radical SAM protein [Candidatus Saganbacteria bacterium]|nr:B12-binding domain-containing radical SAM protein [Candidatus Saganbacteria bacterium]
MPDISLINLSYSYWNNLPLGTLSVASALSKQGIRADLHNCNLNETDLTSFRALIKSSADIVGIGCSISSLPDIIYYIKNIKATHKNKIFILGGPGPTIMHKEILSHFPFINMIACGEAEEIIAPAIKMIRSNDWNSLRNLPGISFSFDKQIHLSEKPAFIRDLDSLPLLDYSLLDLGAYTPISYETARGCIGKCSYCTLKGNFRQKSIERIGLELRQLKRFGVNKLRIVDNTFNVNRDYIKTFCELTKALGLRWSCECRIDNMDERLLEQMGRGGCEEIFFGAESGSDKVLRDIRKGYLSKDIEEIVTCALKHIPSVTASFMWGFPFETFNDFLCTLELGQKLNDRGAFKLLNILTPIPGSFLYRKYKSLLEFYPYKLTPSYIWPRLYFWEKKEKNQLIKLIKQYPDVFPCYYTYRSKGLKKKIDHIIKERISCGWSLGEEEF